MIIDWNGSRSSGRLAALLVAFVLALAGAAAVTSPARAAGCVDATRVFAVDGGTGRLVELNSCRSTPALGPGVEVDSADWRAYRLVTGVFDGNAAVLYAVTADGRLQWRRQPSPGAAFGAPTSVGSSIDWSQFSSVFAPAVGYLHTVGPYGPVRTFRHDGWATGAGPVSEIDPLLGNFAGPSMSAAAWGAYAEGNESGHHFRIWRVPGYPNSKEYADAWYVSGRLPSGVTSVAGAEPELYAVDGAGRVVRLKQPPPWSPGPKRNWDCARQNKQTWSVVTTSPNAGYASVVVPLSHSFTPPAGLNTPHFGEDCDPIDDPWEWQ
ncbi:hypothetical protein Ais01nite_23240 [Asanoa ishikariensis]|uniref:Tachylectin n=1 Tax=Asanoa ishikariensis TaxID=137265 RepID=A0A1H3R8I6_9ACTN|nr:hypothetical protein [Asanoa ishikariensis]GIF64289.1 hypothetical protein Ais01nite_23240 [Asanoa ishikariensis]SDZ21987.1 hypothetical protein SAMN05421684_3590 [Asanoa ishikariensis]